MDFFEVTMPAGKLKRIRYDVIQDHRNGGRYPMARDVVAPWAEASPQGANGMTAQELENLPEDPWHYELVEGRLVRMTPPGGENGDLAIGLASPLWAHVRENHLGRVLGAETGFLISQPGQPDTVLAPDVAFVRADRLPRRGSPEWKSYWRLAPDLVVEIASPSQSRSEVSAKVHLWLAAGTRLVWVVWPENQRVDVWRSATSHPDQILGVDDMLKGDDVVLGFTYAIRQLFA